MTTPKAVDLTPAKANERIQQELSEASAALRTKDLEDALGAYTRALGLALQLGPAPTERVLLGALSAARTLAQELDANGLSALGPALVSLVAQVREADALPPTAVMEAWATVASDVGALIGQIGLVLSIAPNHRQAMMDSARSRAALLDDATDSLFALTAWLDQPGLSS